MDFGKGLVEAYKRKWAFINTFNVQFQFSDLLKTKAGWSEIDERGININIKSINTPQYSNQPIEVYVGDQWKIHNGRNELWRFTITFRDEDQLKLYRKFIKSYNLQKTAYFDQCKIISIKLTKDADYFGENDKTLFDFEDVMIESVGQIQFSNETEAQIAEFDVQFKCIAPEII